MTRTPRSFFLLSGCISFACVASNAFAQLDTNPSPKSLNDQAPAVSALPSKPANRSIHQGDLYLNQWLKVDDNGNIRGSVVVLLGSDTLSLKKVRVSLYQAGIAVAMDDTDVEGEFVMEGVSPGIYTLVAETSDALAVFSLTVLDAVAGGHLPNSVEVRMMSTVGGRALEILRGQVGLSQLTQQFPEQDPLAEKRKNSNSHEVVIDANGTMMGQLSRPVSRVDMSAMEVYITKDGFEVSKTRVASDGKFTVSGLEPGVYGLVAAGDQGVAATAFCASKPTLAMLNADKTRFVGRSALNPVLNIEIGDPIGIGTIPTPENVVANENYYPAPAMSNFGNASMGGGGSFGGGGGGIGAGSGFAGIAGIGGLIAVASILASEDNNKESPVASKIVP